MSALSPAQRLDPFPRYAHVRRSASVAFNAATGSWGVFGYDDARTVLMNPQVYSSEVGQLLAGRTKEEQSLVFTDPPQHAKLRAILSRAFTPHAISRLEGRIGSLADELLDAAVARGEMDLVADFAVPLPMVVIAEMLGVPADDRERFRRWSDAQATVFNQLADMPLAAAYARSNEELGAYFADMLARRRAEPADDLMTRLLAAEVDGERLTEAQLINFCRLLLIAGNETTTHTIGNAVMTLLDHPDELARLRREPALLASAVEEVLRFRGPAQIAVRLVKRDTELGGHTLRAGERVLVMLGSANRDEHKFYDPERFDVARDPNPHIAFGVGIHFCMGAALARLEIRLALAALLDRFEEFARADDAPLEPVDSFMLLGVKRLPLRFRARAGR